MNSILKNPTHVAQIGYNGFNMEQIVDFTAAPAMLLPVYYDLLNPGDKVDCNAQVKLRTMPLETAAEFDATVRLDWFAVPIEQLFKYFGQLYYGIQDIGTDFINVGRSGNFQPSANFPYIQISTYFRYIDTAYKSAAAAYTGSLTFFDYVNHELQPFSGMTSESQMMHLNDSLRLMDFLGYPISHFDDIIDPAYSTSQVGSTFPVTALAYQKIFYDYYRVSDYQINDPHAYNVDSHINSSSQGISAATCLSDIFRLHYIPWKKDFFKNVFSSPMQGAQSISSLGTDMTLVNQWLSGISGMLTSSPAGVSSQTPFGGNVIRDDQTPSTLKMNYGSGLSAATLVGMVNPANIDAMFAVQKALEITRRSGKHYDSQTLAHWGVSVPDTLAGEVIYLGSQTQPMVVGDVISTSASGQEPLGTIAGKGYSGRGVPGSYSAPVKFEAKTHTVLMCVFSVQPDLRYFQEGIDKLNMLVSPADWLHPEYDNLGMQPLFKYQMDITPSTASDVFGWQYSYSELKCKYNRVLGDVGQAGTLKSWVPQAYYFNNGAQTVYYPNFNFAPYYYALPTWLNEVMTYGYYLNNIYQGQLSGSPALSTNYYSLLYERDPFICSAIFDVKKASKMSKYGLQTL